MTTDATDPRALAGRIIQCTRSARLPIVATDQSGYVVGWNEGARALFGVAKDEAVGQPFDVLIDDPDADQACLEAVRRWRAGDCPHPYELRCPGGTVACIPVSLGPARDGASPLLHVMVRPGGLELFSLPPELLPPQVEDDPLLTPREREVLELLAEGTGTIDLADRLSISRATVRNHVQNILGKLGVHSRLEAVAYARRHHLI